MSKSFNTTQIFLILSNFVFFRTGVFKNLKFRQIFSAVQFFFFFFFCQIPYFAGLFDDLRQLYTTLSSCSDMGPTMLIT